MDAKKVDLLIQYALAVAAEEDRPFDRELKPIHLIKYCYLADLAYANEHEGESYTGVRWQFYHYGPWSRDLWQRVEPAARAVGAKEKHFSTERQEDAVSWSLPPETISPENLAPRIPGAVASAVKRSVHEFGSDTASLLHYVYTTEPMLNAAPGEVLKLAPSSHSPQRQQTHEQAPQPTTPSKTSLKKLKKGVQERLQEIRGRSTTPKPQTPPPYDEIFVRGQEWLESLAGDEIEYDEGRVSFADSIWKSIGRREPKLP